MGVRELGGSVGACGSSRVEGYLSSKGISAEKNLGLICDDGVAAGSMGARFRAMNVLLRFIIGAAMAAIVSACSVQPIRTTLTDTLRTPVDARQAAQEENTKKTLSSDILSAIALERVTGRRSPEATVGGL